MVVKANTEGALLGVPMSKHGLWISHRFFVDDSLLFCKSSLTQWNHLSSLLKKYEEALRQRFNCNKTANFFSNNTSLEA